MMTDNDVFRILDAAVVIANVIMFYLSAKVRADIAELKVHIYEKFVTWQGLRDYNRGRDSER